MAQKYGRYSGDFASQMREIAENVKRSCTDGAKYTMDVVQETVIRLCPVDTGRARNGFHVSEGAPDQQSPQMEGPFDVTGEYRIVENRKVIESSTDVDPDFYLQNTVPYVPELNAGSSAQAPAGFIEMGFQAGIAAAKKIEVL